MTYILRIGPWHVGPFLSHTAASHFAESHGCDDYTMIPMDDPAEAPNKIYRLRMGELSHPMKKRQPEPLTPEILSSPIER